MNRIPLVDLQSLNPELAEYQRESTVGKLNIFRLMANAPTCVLPFLGYMHTTFADLALSGEERELIVLAVSHLEGGEYEWIQHLQAARSIGIAESKIDAIAAGFGTHEAFTDREWALLNFTRQVVGNVRVDDAVFSAVAAFYSSRQIVEVIFIIGGYMTVIRLTEVARLEVDAVLGAEVYRSFGGS